MVFRLKCCIYIARYNIFGNISHCARIVKEWLTETQYTLLNICSLKLNNY